MVAGWGGRPFADGNNTCNCINGNCRTVPVEVYESRYPWLVENLSLTEDSGGAGKYRGGLGSTKTLECTADEIIISYMADRHKKAPWGLLGGGGGGSAALLIKKANETRWMDVCEGYDKVSPQQVRQRLHPPWRPGSPQVRRWRRLRPRGRPPGRAGGRRLGRGLRLVGRRRQTLRPRRPGRGVARSISRLRPRWPAGRSLDILGGPTPPVAGEEAAGVEVLRERLRIACAA